MNTTKTVACGPLGPLDMEFQLTSPTQDEYAITGKVDYIGNGDFLIKLYDPQKVACGPSGPMEELSVVIGPRRIKELAIWAEKVFKKSRKYPAKDYEKYV